MIFLEFLFKFLACASIIGFLATGAIIVSLFIDALKTARRKNK
jgi:hypothetical protein